MQRKQFLVGAVFGLVATALAACTTYGKKPEAAEETTSAPATGGAAPPADVLAKTADVPVGGGVIVDETVVTQPAAGDFKGFSATCTHSGCTLAAQTPAGIYVYEEGGVRSSWIVDADGGVTGVLRREDGTTVSAPSLASDATAVVSGRTVKATRVGG